MKKAVLIFMMISSILACMTSCIANSTLNRKKLVGNGVITEQVREKMDFNAIRVGSAIKVFISDVTDIPVKVSGDENLLDYVEITVINGVLNIWFDKKFRYTSRKGIRVTLPNNGRIKKISASGASDVKVESILFGEHIDIENSGSSDFEGDIKAKTCKINSSGSSDVEADIKAEMCKISMSGSSDFEGNIEAGNCNISCSGSADCELGGSADVCTISVSGSSDFEGYAFLVNKLKVDASGASSVEIYCREAIEVKASGASDVYYKGSARLIKKHLSGASTLRQN